MSTSEKKVSFVEDNEKNTDDGADRTKLPSAWNIRARKSGDKTYLDHYQMELARVRAELRLTSYIVQMTEKPVLPHTPNIWNNLKPYTSTFCPEFVQGLPNDTYVGGKSRLTVQNIVDPEVDVQLDQTKVTLPDINLTRRQMLSQMRQERAKQPPAEDGVINPRSKVIPWSQKEGSTGLTPFAKVKYRRPEIAMQKGIIDFADVRRLREQMKSMYSTRAKQKNGLDYKRTLQDYHRMDLNVARDRAHPLNRFLLDQACRVYFGPSRGSLRGYNESTRPITTSDNSVA